MTLVPGLVRLLLDPIKTRIVDVGVEMKALTEGWEPYLDWEPSSHLWVGDLATISIQVVPDQHFPIQLTLDSLALEELTVLISTPDGKENLVGTFLRKNSVGESFPELEDETASPVKLGASFKVSGYGSAEVELLAIPFSADHQLVRGDKIGFVVELSAGPKKEVCRVAFAIEKRIGYEVRRLPGH
jgi:hypothetical protein